MNDNSGAATPDAVATLPSPEASLRFPEVFAFVASGSLLVLELVAGRLLAPTIGVSLYTWTSVIGVVLGGIALGNWLGGRLADRHPTRGMLGLLFVLASAATLLILALITVVDVIRLPAGAPAILQVLWLFGVMFFLPAAIIGAVTPLLTRIALHSLESTGRVVGRIQAAAALGSIVGTFLTGYLLISAFGTRWLIAGVAVVMLVLAVAARPPWLRKAPAAALVIALGVVAFAGGVASGSGCTRESDYYCIRVTPGVLTITTADGREVTTVPPVQSLFLDHTLHGVVNLIDTSQSLYGYLNAYAAALASTHSPGSRVDAFLVGGGAFVFPRYLEKMYQGRTTIAEIDPEVTIINSELLGLAPSERMTILDDDGRAALRSLPTETKFDTILGDATDDFGVPYQLTTREYHELVASHLQPDGVYLMNLVDGVDYDLLRSEIRTLRLTFPHVQLMTPTIPWPPDGRSDTFVVAASTRPLLLADAAIPASSLDAFVENGHSVILTDDFAPVDQLLAPVFERSIKADGD